jgi:peptide alpha-N-acetyltransferase
MLMKGVPSLFANVKHLYSDPAKKDELLRLVQKYLDENENQTNGGEDKKANGDSSKGTGAALYYLAQHFNYHLSRDLDKAMEYVERAIELDAENVDFHMTKARIFKHRGDTRSAAAAMDHARSLDLRDRYINTKAAKYQLRNNESDKALKTMSAFTRAETVGGPLADLMEMQCVWYMTEDGESCARQGKIGLALKRLHFVHNIFDIWQEDQFDFHSFSLRKGQIRAYVDTVRWEDHLREHPFYSRAALGAVKLYLQLADSRQPAANGSINGVSGGAGGVNGGEAAEKKKAAKKAKKEQARLEREAAERAAKQDPNKPGAAGAAASSNKDDAAKKKDDDPTGSKLAATTEPLADAMKYLNNLLEYSPKNILAQLVGFDVYMRRSE